MDFNPRPPRGGRLIFVELLESHGVFQSTPSARRATIEPLAGSPEESNFNPRPPRGGRPSTRFYASLTITISIHALREEGDSVAYSMAGTPPQISIHALREEGDAHSSPACLFGSKFNPRPPRGGRQTVRIRAEAFGIISIHALREEGDRCYRFSSGFRDLFQSTPSARRAT